MSQLRVAVLVALALVVFGAVAWVTLKPGPSLAATLTNRALFVFIMSAATLFAFRSRSAPGSLSIAIVAWTTGLFFLAASTLFAAHLGAVVSLPLRAAAAPYDFRMYSLLLLGVVGIVPSVLGMRAIPGLARGTLACGSRRRARHACFALLAVSIPLIPLQDFAIALSISGASVLVGLSLSPDSVDEDRVVSSRH